MWPRDRIELVAKWHFQAVFLQRTQYLLQLARVLLPEPTKDEYVVQEDYHELSEIRPQAVIHQPHEGGRRIRQAKSHHPKLILSEGHVYGLFVHPRLALEPGDTQSASPVLRSIEHPVWCRTSHQCSGGSLELLP